MDARKIFREKYGKRLAEQMKKGFCCCLIDSEDLSELLDFVAVDNSFIIKKDNIGFGYSGDKFKE